MTAVDTSANESADSNQDCATTQATPGTMHVDSITVTLMPAPGPHDVPHAEVVILDDGGAAVEGATVTGSFSGDTNQSGLSGVTDASGLAVIEGKKDKNLVSITFCVDDVTHATLTYDPTDNVETCDSL